MKALQYVCVRSEPVNPMECVQHATNKDKAVAIVVVVGVDVGIANCISFNIRQKQNH